MDAQSRAEWVARCADLADRIRAAARAALASDDLAERTRAVRSGAGDVTYGLDERCEAAVEAWFEETARERPLSLLTEDTGWRHRGPGERGARELADFDHGGPRLALDPVDGTRGLMHDLRPAWSVVSLARPGPGEPRLADLVHGALCELPDSRGARYRVLAAQAGGACRLEERALDGAGPVRNVELAADSDGRADHGFFPFFRYEPAWRPELARVEAAFFERLARHEGAQLRHVFDDQYISNAGQLALLSLGTYRMIADLRAWLAARRGASTTSTKPYDVAGAILVARAAGCVLEAPEGGALDFALDCTTPVSFVGWANRATAQRLGPHLRAVLAEL
jgi:fructose-1,6-bisphosphatase/inositol monophosphatase family enzyme